MPGEGGCSPIRTYNRLFVAEHGRISGRHAMKAEIAARGPISCGIDATLALDEYEGVLLAAGRTDPSLHAPEDGVYAGWSVNINPF